MDIETRRKISRAMKGKSNFQGKTHTHATKIQIGISQEGHRNAANHKWVTDKETGQEHRVKGDKPKGTRWGRSGAFSRWIHKEEAIIEAKATMCGRCGTVHVKPQDGGTCPALSKERNAALRKEEKEVWDKPSPAKNTNPLSSSAKARAKARAKAAGRPYPNMVDNMWAARNEGVDSGKRLEGTSSLAMRYLKDTPGQGRKKMTKKIDEANIIDVPAYRRKPLTLDTLRKALTKDKMGNDKISHKDVLAKNTGMKTEETVNELSKDTLKSYTKGSALDSTRLGNTLGRLQVAKSKNQSLIADKIGKRLKGISIATDKLSKK